MMTADQQQWTAKRHNLSPGIGKCYFRSRYHGARYGHLFECKMTVGKVMTMHCSWCWAEEF